MGNYLYAVDNGAMIAVAGLLGFLNGGVTELDRSVCSQRYRTDQARVGWRG